ncbi:MAG: hypothetical protein J7K84_06675 [Deltaproteobacteria bacterium]|nr:hypothetical protein [Deltaproteobacteria bacterium]
MIASNNDRLVFKRIVYGKQSMSISEKNNAKGIGLKINISRTIVLLTWLDTISNNI